MVYPPAPSRPVGWYTCSGQRVFLQIVERKSAAKAQKRRERTAGKSQETTRRQQQRDQLSRFGTQRFGRRATSHILGAAPGH
jgi:hypothetical protein